MKLYGRMYDDVLYASECVLGVLGVRWYCLWIYLGHSNEGRPVHYLEMWLSTCVLRIFWKLTCLVFRNPAGQPVGLIRPVISVHMYPGLAFWWLISRRRFL